MNRPLPFSLFFALLFLFQSINLSSSPAPSPLFGVGGGGFLVCLFFFFFAFWSFTALSTWAASYFSAPIFIPPTPSRENIVTIRIFFFFFKVYILNSFWLCAKHYKKGNFFIQNCRLCVTSKNMQSVVNPSHDFYNHPHDSWLLFLNPIKNLVIAMNCLPSKMCNLQIYPICMQFQKVQKLSEPLRSLWPHTKNPAGCLNTFYKYHTIWDRRSILKHSPF